MSNILAQEVLKQIEAEVPATRKCLERIPANLFGYKPHEKSMAMGYVAFIVADIPRWIVATAKSTELDFAKFKHDDPKTPEDLIRFFDEHMKSVRNAFSNLTDEKLNETFYLKFNGQVVWESSKLDNITSSIRHLAHHRGQLTVYMRLNNIPVPAIYGPTADEPAQ
jgi:uncharacterized damage-inducible protein DinB